MKTKFISCQKTVKNIIRAMPQGMQFHGWELKELCVASKPELKNTYVETFLREMRATSKGHYICISRAESLYKKITPMDENYGF